MFLVKTLVFIFIFENLSSRDAHEYNPHFVIFGRFLTTIENNDESNGNNRSIELRSVLH